MKLGVIGLGIMGRQHARIIKQLEDVHLVAVCDRSPENRDWGEQRLNVPTSADWRDLLDRRIDAVVNALPTKLHFEVTRQCLASGLHVLVEKPLAAQLEQAKQLEALARAQGLTLMVGHVERFNPAIQTLKTVIDSGRLGTLINMSARRVGIARPTIPSANVAIDLATHDLDIFSYLSGQPGSLLHASGSAIESNVLEDHVDLILEFGGTVASAQANWVTPVKIRRLSITGSRGLAEVNYIDQSIQLFESFPEVIKGTPRDFFAVSKESSPSSLPVRRREPLQLELRHFAECIRHGVAPVSDAASTTPALALAIEATSRIRESG